MISERKQLEMRQNLIKPFRYINTRFLVLLGFVLFQSACPMTCIFRPFQNESLVTSGTIYLDGVLLNYEGSDIAGVLANIRMPCRFVNYGLSYDDYLEPGGMFETSCETTSSSSGMFVIDFSVDDPGLYRFNFLSPIIQAEKRLFTVLPSPPASRPDFRSPDQDVYIDWETQEHLIRDSIVAVYRDTLDSAMISDFSDEDLVTITKEEVARMVERAFDGLRINLVDGPGTSTQKIEMTSCNGVYNDESCENDPETFGAGYGACYALDYLNLDPSEFPCFAMVHAVAGQTAFNPSDPEWSYLSPSDTVATRATDFGIALARTITHEITHSFGLVHTNMFGSVVEFGGHNPTEPPFLATERYIPWDFMKGPETPGSGSVVGDCNIYPRVARPPGEPIQRCYYRWNSLNRSYLFRVFGGSSP